MGRKNLAAFQHKATESKTGQGYGTWKRGRRDEPRNEREGGWSGRFLLPVTAAYDGACGGAEVAPGQRGDRARWWSEKERVRPKERARVEERGGVVATAVVAECSPVIMEVAAAAAMECESEGEREKKKKERGLGREGDAVAHGSGMAGAVDKWLLVAEMMVVEVMNMPDLAMQSLALTIHHLKEFGFERIAILKKYGNDLFSQYILKNNSDGSENGTLLQIMNRTLTIFGSRLLRHWSHYVLLLCSFKEQLPTCSCPCNGSSNGLLED
ncbi:hypothetical protein Ahy_B08g092325 [Arachis hypogaea]|uniref:Uncharacterized protein n=1 Tax=Arachis hypogaea TaxID=3818 RepID=A0A444Y3P6_ARAHY|nr:hypothetical protein Ahy_B08g092325 [Arachis hypogaea]